MKKRSFLKKILCYVFDSKYRFETNYRRFKGHYDKMPDEKFVKKRYRAYMGKRLDLIDPKTFNEKLQWLKLYDHKDLYTTLVDKYAVKRYVAEVLGEEYVIPALGVWDRFEDIDLGALPERFVLKCTHDSGSVVICKDKSKFDKDKAEKIINASLKNDYYKHSREWPYKNVPHRIIAEKYLEDETTKELRDYKVYTFNGEAKIMMLASNRFSSEQTCFDYFDREKRSIDLKWGNPNSSGNVALPDQAEEIFVLAEKLSKGIPQVRVDMYLANDRIYFGEMTFFDGSGMTEFEPEEWDKIFGDWIVLPKQAKGEK